MNTWAGAKVASAGFYAASAPRIPRQAQRLQQTARNRFFSTSNALNRNHASYVPWSHYTGEHQPVLRPVPDHPTKRQSPLVVFRKKRRRLKPSPLPSIPDDFFKDCVPFIYKSNGSDSIALLPVEDPDPRPPQLSLPPMHSYIQVFSSPTADTPGTCLLLHFDTRRYLFGHVAEGTQRLAIQRGVALSKVSDVFLTGSVNSFNTAGLLGMILTIADVHGAVVAAKQEQNNQRVARGLGPQPIEKPRLGIHGGKNLTHTLASGRFFVLRNSLALRPHEILTDPRSQDNANCEPDFEDPLIRVWNVPLMRCDSPGSKKRRRSLSPEVSEPQGPKLGEAEGQKLREAVVQSMFESDWKLDNLLECMLSEVRLPAKVFFRGTDGFIHKYEGPLPGQEGFKDIRVLVRRPWPAAEVPSIPPTTPSQDSMCYIIKEQPRRGRFLPQEAIRLGVPPIMRKNLAAGESVTLKDGTVVTPEQVLSPSSPPSAVAILDVRHPGLLDSLLTRPEWQIPEMTKDIVAMYWTISEDVKEDPRLAQFMRHFDAVQHVVLGENISPNQLAFHGACRVSQNLNKLDKDRFPLPIVCNETARLPSTWSEKTRVARPGEILRLAPKVEWVDTEIVKPTDPADTPPNQLEKVNKANKIFQLAQAAAKKVADADFISQVEASETGIPQRDVEIVTLGTGSSVPSKYRNVTGTLLRIPGYGTCILDCGENTLGQLRRTFGHAETDEILKQLRFIYISHLHADHHLGTATVLARLGKLQTPDMPPVAIICPKKFTGFLQECGEVESLARSVWVTRAPYPPPRPNNRVLWEHSPEWVRENLGLSCLSAVNVDHCHDAMAAAFTWPSGLKIAWSGDCRPSRLFSAIGRGAHLLIHECTFDDDRQGDALAKKHSTISEALTIGRSMRARRVLLTHFSQRYPRMQDEQNLLEEIDARISRQEEQARAAAAAAVETAEEVEEAVEEEDFEEEDVEMDEDTKKFNEKIEALERNGRRNEKREDLRQMVEQIAGPPVEPLEKLQQTVLFAFDHMRVKLGEFQYAAEFLPAVRMMSRNDTQNEDNNDAESVSGGSSGGESDGEGGGPSKKSLKRAAKKKEREETKRKEKEEKQKQQKQQKQKETQNNKGKNGDQKKKGGQEPKEVKDQQKQQAAAAAE